MTQSLLVVDGQQRLTSLFAVFKGEVLRGSLHGYGENRSYKDVAGKARRDSRGRFRYLMITVIPIFDLILSSKLPTPADFP